MLVSLPPSDHINAAMQSRITLAASRPEYGTWSSSGHPTAPGVEALAASSSGQTAAVQKEQDQWPLFAACFKEVIDRAAHEGVQLSGTALQQAFAFAREFSRQIAPLSFNSPHLSFSSDGEVVLEWRKGHKQVVFYVSATSILFIRAWGADIFNEMEEGEILSMPEVHPLWRWLHS